MKKLRITVLFDTFNPPPENQDYAKLMKAENYGEPEYEVAKALISRGHEVMMLGFYDNVKTIIDNLENQKPQIVFNMTEHFFKQAWLDRSIADLLEILKYPYTGSDAAALLIARDKAITKEILTFHRIKVPRFTLFLMGSKIRIPNKIIFPQIVKPVGEDASFGIAKSSIVENADALIERIIFVHQSLKRDAISEQFIPGRELYIGILGNERLKVLPIREMKFGDDVNGEDQIATYKAKWDEEYREKNKIKNVFASDIADDLLVRIHRVCKRTYKALRLRDYARVDIRLTPEREIYVIEANPNPYLAMYEDFPESAKKAGMEYNDLVERIIQLALKRYGL